MAFPDINARIGSAIGHGLPQPNSSFNRSGFVRGTLVHTNRGLMPIEALKVGDLVLSRPHHPQADPELIQHRVVRVVVHEDMEVMNAAYMTTPKLRVGTRLFNIFCNRDQPFWVEQKGWTVARKLTGDWLGSSPLTALDGTVMYAYPLEVFAMGRRDCGWIADTGFHGPGRLWSFGEGRALENVHFDMHTWPWDDVGDVDGSGFVYRTTLYNVEVEVCHTLFVGEHGIWVGDSLYGPDALQVANE